MTASLNSWRLHVCNHSKLQTPAHQLLVLLINRCEAPRAVQALDGCPLRSGHLEFCTWPLQMLTLDMSWPVPHVPPTKSTTSTPKVSCTPCPYPVALGHMFLLTLLLGCPSLMGQQLYCLHCCHCFVPLQKLPTARQKAETLVKEVVRYRGTLEEVLSDRGPQFISRFWRAFWQLMGVTLCLTSGYHSQTNGQTEPD